MVCTDKTLTKDLHSSMVRLESKKNNNTIATAQIFTFQYG